MNPWTVPCQASLAMEFSMQGYWSGLSFPSPGDPPNPRIEPQSPSLQTDSLPSKPPGKPIDKFGPCLLDQSPLDRLIAQTVDAEGGMSKMPFSCAFH